MVSKLVNSNVTWENNTEKLPIPIKNLFSKNTMTNSWLFHDLIGTYDRIWGASLVHSFQASPQHGHLHRTDAIKNLCKQELITNTSSRNWWYLMARRYAAKMIGGRVWRILELPPLPNCFLAALKTFSHKTRFSSLHKRYIHTYIHTYIPVSYTHLTLPTIYSV